MTTRRIYSWISMLASLSILMVTACQREEIIPVDSGADSRQSRMSSAVLVLDTNALINPVKSIGQLRFDVAGTVPEIKKGDYIFYPARGGFYGYVTQSFLAGGRLTLGINTNRLDKIWPDLLIRDTVTPDQPVSKKRAYSDAWHGDTLAIANLVLHNGLWQGKMLNITFPMLKVYPEFVFDHKIMASGSDPWLKRYHLNADYFIIMTGEVVMVADQAINARDSLLIEETLYASTDQEGVPVTYQLRTWLGYHFVCESDTTLKFEFSDTEAGSKGFMKNDWSGWATTGDQDLTDTKISQVIVPILKDSYGEVFLRFEFIPVLAGESSIKWTGVLSESLKRQVDLPDWTQTAGSYFHFDLQPAGAALMDQNAGIIISEEKTLYVDEQSGKLPNQKPRADFSFNPKIGFVNTNFEFNATACTDFESGSDQLSVRWDFESDNVFDTDYSTNKIAYHIYTTAGTYQATLEVKDPSGLTDRAIVSIEVNPLSSAPIAHFNVSPESGRISTLFVFDASGCVDAQDPITALQVRWDFDGDGTWDTDFTTQKAQGYFFRNPGNFITKLEVLDSEGLTGSTSKLIKVLDANIKPTAIFKVDPVRGTTETLFTFDASGSTDPEDSPELLTVRWDWDNDGYWDTEARTQKIIQHRFTEAGNYTVVVEVTDTEGFASTFSKQVTVTNPNTPPTADFTITPVSGTTETEFEFNATISVDAEDNIDQIEVRWDWNNDDIYDTEFTTEKIIRRKFAVPGTYIIMLQVRDSGGLTDTKARLLVIE